MERLERLFAGLYPGEANPVKSVSDAQLASFLRRQQPRAGDALNAIHEAFADTTLTCRQRGLVGMADSILADYFTQAVFHPQLGECLRHACGGLMALALNDDGWLVRRRHPAGALLTRIAEVAQGWHPGNPRAAHIRDTLAGWLAGAADTAGTRKAVAQAEDWISRFHERRQRVTKRVKETESGLLEMRHARQHAVQALNRQVAGRDLPEFMAESLAQQWMSAFQRVLLNEGENSPVWLRLNRCFGLLLWTLQPEAAQAGQREKLQRVIGRLRNELREVLESAMPDDVERNDLLDSIQVAHLCQLHNRPMDLVRAPVVDRGAISAGTPADAGRDIPAEVQSLHPGRWFQVNATGERLQLLLRNDQSRQLVFVNQPGMRALEISFEAFAGRIGCGDAIAVPEPGPLAQWVSDSVETLFGAWCARRREPGEAVPGVSPTGGGAAILSR